MNRSLSAWAGRADTLPEPKVLSQQERLADLLAEQMEHGSHVREAIESNTRLQCAPVPMLCSQASSTPRGSADQVNSCSY